jgi:hypothetical protein
MVFEVDHDILELEQLPSALIEVDHRVPGLQRP